MSLNVAVQMDPVEHITIRGDTTFALMLEAQARGHALSVYTPDVLSMQGGDVSAVAAPVTVRDEQGLHATLGRAKKVHLADYDVVLLRQDPPFDMFYITTTHLLERIHPDTLVVNDPAAVRDAPEKIFVTDYPHFMPPTLITRDPAAVAAFRAEHRDVIVKPLYGNGGAGIFHIRPDDENLGSLMEMFLATFREPFVVQAYLPEVRKGDKRIILIEGEPVGALNRVPGRGEARSNLHVGGKAEASDITGREREICAAIGPELRRRGLTLVGIDVIGDFMTEVNVTSPTGIREIEAFGGPNIAALFWDAVEARRSGDVQAPTASMAGG